MTTRAEYLALAERAERAEGADRELDAEIAVAVHGGEIRWRPVLGTMDSEPHLMAPSANHVGGFMRMPVLTFTASLDAALSLVPEGWRVNTADWSIKGRYTWMLKGPCTKYVVGPDGYNEAGSDWFKQGISEATPALALVAAALRARAEEAKDGE